MEAVGLNLTSRNNSYPLKNKNYSGIKLTSKPDQVTFGADAAAIPQGEKLQQQNFLEEPMILDEQSQQGNSKKGLIATLFILAALGTLALYVFIKGKGSKNQVEEEAQKQGQALLEKLKEDPAYKEIAEIIENVRKQAGELLEKLKGNKEKTVTEFSTEIQNQEKALNSAKENIEKLLTEINSDNKEATLKRLEEEISKMSGSMENIEKFNESIARYLAKKEEITQNCIAQKEEIMQIYKVNGELSQEGQEQLKQLQEVYNLALNKCAQENELLIPIPVPKQTVWQRIKNVFCPKEQQVYNPLPNVPIP